MFMAALFTIDQTWTQPEYPFTDEWIKKLWYIYTMKYHTGITQKKIMPFTATWMQSETIVLREVSEKEKGKYLMISLTYGI